MRPRFDDEGAAQVIGFLMAGLLFVASVGGLLVWTNLSGPSPQGVEQAAQEVDVDALSALLASSPGQGWQTPDQLSRLGLAGAGESLNMSHIALLRNGSLSAASANGYVDYPEALASFGLPATSGFHLTITPLAVGQALQQFDFSHTKVLYIGDWVSLATITLPLNNATIANANVQLALQQSNSSLWERDVLHQIGVEFDDEVHLTLANPNILVQITTVPSVKIPLLTHLGGLTLWDGDVLFDDKQYLDAVLPDKLANGGYDLVVVGAGIDHNTLTSNAVKGSIDNWTRAGGTLMVFGATGNNFGWMQPMFSVSATTVSGNVSAPDPGHDLLDTPWDLPWAQYNTQGLAWDIATPSNFDRVLMQGGKDVLAISKPNTIGTGMVFLSSLKTNVVGAALGSSEAQHLLYNMLLYQVHVDPSNLTLDYGPPVPTDQSVSSAVRIVTLEDPTLGTVPARLQLWVWGTGGT